MKPFFFYFFAALVVISACAGKRTLKGASPAPAVLIIVNDHPMDYEIEVDGEADVVEPHSQIVFPAHSGTVYKIRRRIYGLGYDWSDVHPVGIPRGATEKTVIYGGVQTGVILNYSGVQPRVKVATPNGGATDWIESGKGAVLKLQPGMQLLVFKFEDGWAYSTYTDKPIDDIRADVYLEDCDCWVDFIVRVIPEMYTQAKKQ